MRRGRASCPRIASKQREHDQSAQGDEREACPGVIANIRRDHGGFLSTASNFFHHHTARFLAGKARMQEQTVVATREREAVMVVAAALLEALKWVEPETSALRVAFVAGWSAATWGTEARLVRVAQAHCVACVVSLQAGREVETGNREKLA